MSNDFTKLQAERARAYGWHPHEQALSELAQRVNEYVRDGIQSSEALALRINELHADLISHPRGKRWH